MIDYTHHPCSTCSTPSTGVFYEENNTRTFYCNRHFFARQSTIDRDVQASMDAMFTGKYWYTSTKSKAPATALSDQYKNLKNRQQSLFQ